MRRNTPEVFWSRVDTSGGPDACHLWTGRTITFQDGPRAVYDHDGTWDYAYRYAWLLTFGMYPTQLNHGCDQPLCCNLRHVYEGTQAQNVKDRDARGRRDVKGERHPRALFTQEQVDLIRELVASGRWTQTSLARETGFNVTTINKIVRGKNYRDSN